MHLARRSRNQTDILQEAAEDTEKSFPRISRMTADKTVLFGSVSATISEIRGELDFVQIPQLELTAGR